MDRLVLKKSAYSLLPPLENVSVKLHTHSQQNACDIGLRLNLRLHLTLVKRSSLQFFQKYHNGYHIPKLRAYVNHGIL